MTVFRLRTTIAGFLVLLSLALGAQGSPLFHNANWLWFTVFVGANLFQSGLTGFCPMDWILAKLGVPKSEASAAVR